MKKNYGTLYLFGNTINKELQVRTIKEPSEIMLQEEVERSFRAIQACLSPQNKIPNDPEQIEGIKRALKLGLKSSLTVSIEPQIGYVRIGSDGYGISNITEIAKKYSISSNLPTLFWSGYDDSIMILGVAAYGEIQTTHIISDEEASSPFANKHGDGDIFRKYIRVNDEEAFTTLLREKDIFIAQDLVPKAFDIIP